MGGRWTGGNTHGSAFSKKRRRNKTKPVPLTPKRDVVPPDAKPMDLLTEHQRGVLIVLEQYCRAEFEALKKGEDHREVQSHRHHQWWYRPEADQIGYCVEHLSGTGCLDQIMMRTIVKVMGKDGHGIDELLGSQEYPTR